MQNLTEQPKHALLDEVQRWQTVQKNNHSRSSVWEHASRMLAPLFAELARRQKESSR